MVDIQETKLKYCRGICFSCRKCLYCGIDLQQNICNCNLSDAPHRVRLFNPNWVKEQIDYVRQKNSTL